LKPADRWILPVIESYASGLTPDKPGLTEAEGRVVEIAQIARGASMLILAECARSGFTMPVKGSWARHQGLELAEVCPSNARLQSGVGEMEKPALTLSEYLNGKPQPVGKKVVVEEPAAMTIVENQDPHLYGGLPVFQDLTTWWRWLVFIKSAWLSVDEAELAALQYHTAGRLQSARWWLS
jgi:hypothetical protein